MNRFYVYVYEHPEKGVPIYIGKGTGNRYKEHLTYSSNKILENKMKHWRESSIDVNYYIHRSDLTEEEALELEAELISKYGTVVDKTGTLYNISKGGKGNSKFVFDDNFYSRLGKINDSVLAAEYGTTRSNVSYIRRGLGIKRCFEKPNYKPPPDNAGWNKKNIPEDKINLIGTMSDSKLSEQCGCSKSVIARIRKSLGIESYASRTGNNGKFKDGSLARMDKTLHQFLNIKSGEGFIGNKVFFADYLGIKSGRVAELVTGRVKLLCKEWVYVGVLT